MRFAGRGHRTQHRYLGAQPFAAQHQAGPDRTYAAENRNAVNCGIANSIAANTIIVITSSTCARFSKFHVLEAGVGHARDHQAAERQRQRRHQRAQHRAANRIRSSCKRARATRSSRPRRAPANRRNGACRRCRLHVKTRKTQRRANHEYAADDDAEAPSIRNAQRKRSSPAPRRRPPRRRDCRTRLRTGSRSATRRATRPSSPSQTNAIKIIAAANSKCPVDRRDHRVEAREQAERRDRRGQQGTPRGAAARPAAAHQSARIDFQPQPRLRSVGLIFCVRLIGAIAPIMILRRALAHRLLP